MPSAVLAGPDDILSTVKLNADSLNQFIIDQTGDTDTTQTVGGIVNAITDAAVTQTVTPDISVILDQQCDSGTVCLQHATPSVNITAAQEVTASAANLLNISQAAVSGIQVTALTGAALTTVDARQMVSPEVLMQVTQNCAVSEGACVQSALPVVETFASQIISASALNGIDTTQILNTDEGSAQAAAIDALAATKVYAEQVVTPTAVVTLVQTCKMDTGLCLQDALALLNTFTEQTIRAQAGNAISITQAGAEDQIAAAADVAGTLVDTAQEVAGELTVTVVQQCDILKGLCIQSQNGLQQYVFADGDTKETGEYLGVLDTHALDTGFNRQTVTTVAMGICPEGSGLCPHVQQLLTWLFGPEEQPAAESATQSVSVSQSDPRDSVRRGHQTNVIGGIIRFFSRNRRPTSHGTIAFADVTLSALDDEGKALFCQVRKNIGETDVAMRMWAIHQMADVTGIAEDDFESAFDDPTLCDTGTATAHVESQDPVIAFPIDETGPVSTNTLWNDCVREKYVSYEQIKANPDRDPHTGRPRSCGSYHTRSDWVHPDLGIHFTWDPASHTISLPVGYVAIPQRSVAVEDDLAF